MVNAELVSTVVVVVGGGSSDGSAPGVGDFMNTYSTFPSILGLGAN